MTPAKQTTPKDPTHLTSLAERILWAGWELGAKRRPTMDDVEKLRRVMLITAQDYLPDLRKLEKKGQTK
jgi:hypothetical protein